MAAKKKHLRALPGGRKHKTPGDLTQVYASDRPLIQIVLSSELDPAKGLRAENYVHRTYHEQKLVEAKERLTEKDVEHARGRSQLYPEINVLNAAKAWYRRILRMSRSEGFKDVREFFKKSENVNADDKRLFDATKAFIEWENKLPRRG